MADYPFKTRLATLTKPTNSGLGIALLEAPDLGKNVVVVSEIREGSVSSQCANLKVDDVIVEINGHKAVTAGLDVVMELIGAVQGGEELRLLLAPKADVLKSIDEATAAHILGANVPEEHTNKTVSQLLQEIPASDALHQNIKLAIYDMTVPLTTRPPRTGEVNGVDYNFVSREEFEELIEKDRFMEHGERNGNLYGTLKVEATDVQPADQRPSRRKTMKQAIEQAPTPVTLRHILGDRAGDLGGMTVDDFLSKVPADHQEHGEMRKEIQTVVYDVTTPVTSRPKREGEVNGREYHFVSKEKFSEMIQSGRFMEYGDRKGNFYGTLKVTMADLADYKVPGAKTSSGDDGRRETLKEAVANNETKEASVSAILKHSGLNKSVGSNMEASRFLATVDDKHPDLSTIRQQVKSAIYDMTVPLTTREPREGEVNGVDYNFVSRDTFENYIKADAFIEYGENKGVYYGTLKITEEQVKKPVIGGHPRNETFKKAVANGTAGPQASSPQKPNVTVDAPDDSWHETLV